jgi:hypothetical protein
LLITLSKPIDYLISFTGGESLGAASNTSASIAWFYLSSLFLLHQKLSGIFLAVIGLTASLLSTPLFYLSLLIGEVV